MKHFSIPGTGKRFYLVQSIHADTEVHSASFETGNGSLSEGKKRLGHEGNHRIVPVPMLGMRVAIIPLPNTPSCRVQGKIYYVLLR